MRPLRAAAVLACLAVAPATVGTDYALAGSPLVSLSGSGTHVGIAVGETSVVGVNLPSIKGAPSVPEVNASVGGSEPDPQLVGVSVGGQPALEVPNPVGSLPVPQPPPATSEQPSGTSTAPAGASGGESGSGSPRATSAGTDAGRAGVSAGGRAGQASRPRKTTRGTGTRRAGHAPAAGGATAAVVLLAPASARAHGASAARPSASGSGNPLDVLGRTIPLPLPVPDWSKPIILALLLIALAFAVRSQLASRRARRLEAQRATLQRDIEVMQSALVPEIPDRLGGLCFSGAYRPADGPAAGGDFYDVFAPAPGQVAIVLGDVAGHGFSAVKHAALTRYTLRAYLQAGLEPRAALALAGKALADHAEEVLATVAVGLYDSDSATLAYALAGHPPPIVLGLDARESVSICCSPPLGWSVPTGRRQRTLSLPAGAQVCFFSDGLIEARCACGGADMLLGRERLTDLLAAQLGPEPSAGALLASVGAAAIATPDDMAACILTSEAPPGTARVDTEELELDRSAIEAGPVRELLAAWGVPSAEIDTTLEQASVVAARCGSAILHAEHAPHAGASRVTVARPATHEGASEPRPLPAGSHPDLTASRAAVHATLVE